MLDYFTNLNSQSLEYTMSEQTIQNKLDITFNNQHNKYTQTKAHCKKIQQLTTGDCIHFSHEQS